MSAVAVQWAKRQVIDDRTLTSLLSLLAKKADACGRCEIKQARISEMIGVSPRTVERSMPILEFLQLIRRHRNVSYQKRGRSADTIYLCMDRELEITKVKIREVKTLGPTRQNVGKKSRDQLAKMSGAPTVQNAASIYIARRRGIEAENSPLKTSILCSTRVRFDRERSQWRARIQAKIKDDKLNMELGRFNSEAEANEYAANAKADVLRTSTAKPGTPSNPCVKPMINLLEGKALADFLFGRNHPSASPAGARTGQGAKLLAGVGSAHKGSGQELTRAYKKAIF